MPWGPDHKQLEHNRQLGARWRHHRPAGVLIPTSACATSAPSLPPQVDVGDAPMKLFLLIVCERHTHHK
eukprot:1119215-Pelagomonas_calceolata.AAC.9